MTVDVLDLVEQHQAGQLTVVFNQPVHGFQYTTTERSVLPPRLAARASLDGRHRPETSRGHFERVRAADHRMRADGPS
jgi:hypothetical protein